MPMAAFRYTVRCRCGAPATHKVAAGWSDGQTAELKTYGLVCAACLPAKLAEAQVKHAACRRAEGETLEPPTSMLLQPVAHDRPLQP